jgi:HEAT repeat protein
MTRFGFSAAIAVFSAFIPGRGFTAVEVSIDGRAVMEGLRSGRPDSRRAALKVLEEAAGEESKIPRAWSFARALERGGLPPEKLAPALAAGLKDADPEIRAKSAELLGLLGERARPHQGELVGLLADRDPVVRCLAVGALGNIRPELGDLLPSLVVTLKDESPNVRARAVAVITRRFLLGVPLADQEAKAAVPVLVPLLKESSADLRSTAALCLWRLGTAAKTAKADLAGALGDKKSEVRRYAAAALLTIEPGCSAAESALLAELDALTQMLRSPGGVDVIVAADVVALLGPKAKRVVRTLLEVAAQPRQWADPGQAAEKALARIGSAAIADLEAALRDPDEGIRRAAERVLERLRAPGGEPGRLRPATSGK